MDRYQPALRLVQAMSMMHEEHNHHGQNVAVYARKLAEAVGIPSYLVDMIEIGAHLHDLGKLMIDKKLLNAPRALTQEERTLVRRHTEIGWALSDLAGFDEPISEIIRHHHERYDGNGYPDRLHSHQIPIGAQIVAICDVYAALVAPRTYRAAYTPQLARSIVQADKGEAFAPHLVDVFFEKVVTE